jgi:hypothetical protein
MPGQSAIEFTLAAVFKDKIQGLTSMWSTYEFLRSGTTSDFVRALTGKDLVSAVPLTEVEL